jgi:hypothetical protein
LALRRALFARVPDRAARRIGWTTRSTLLLALALMPGFLDGCGNTPTLPLPPPTALVGSPNLQGLVTVAGDADDDAYVTVLNEQTDNGKITHASPDGHYTLQIEAMVGDKLVIWQEREGIAGERTEQTVPEARP